LRSKLASLLLSEDFSGFMLFFLLFLSLSALLDIVLFVVVTNIFHLKNPFFVSMKINSSQ